MVYRLHLSTQGDGMAISARSLLTQLSLLDLYSQNISHYGIPGYKRVDPTVTSFAETLGPWAVRGIESQEVGRIRLTQNPMDVALTGPGFFQKALPSGQVELTRDGRFRIGKDGTLTALDGHAILSTDQQAIRFDPVPQDIPRQVKIDAEGVVYLLDARTRQQQVVGRIGVVDAETRLVANPQLAQKHVEDSNVFLQQEFVGLMPVRRNFEANRQMFILQSDNLSRMIQELGRP